MAVTPELVGVSIGSRLEYGKFYRITFVNDAGFYYSVRFDSRMAALWDNMASSGMVMPITQLAITASATTAVVDVRATSSGNTIADVIRWLEDAGSSLGLRVIKVSRFERLMTQAETQNAKQRETLQNEARAAQDAERLSVKLGGVLDSARTAVRNVVVLLLIVGIIVLTVKAGVIRSALK